MKTSVEIDKKLYQNVKEVLVTETLKDTIKKSFEEVLHHKALENSARLLGKIDLDLTVDLIRKQRRIWSRFRSFR
ncbi:MAG: hypothetical protein WAO55_10250 [Candidatus Manganitrophaceae bacterium]